MRWRFFIFVILLPTCFSFDKAKHHNNAEVEATLKYVNSKCPTITKLRTLNDFKGVTKTKHGNVLIVIEFGSPPGVHLRNRPEFKYIGNMHGNEVVSREILLGLVIHLCKRWNEGDKGIKSLILRTRIHILVTMNPDGWQIATNANYEKRNRVTGRRTADNIDLNRNFPQLDKRVFLRTFAGKGRIDHVLNKKDDYKYNMARETEMVINWILPIPFVLSANLHGGELVANYPYDRLMYLVPGHYVYSACPDDTEFRRLSHVYANNHLKMSQSRYFCGKRKRFEDGITNGADWYSVIGGMQDFNYLASNAFEITLEVSCIKYPPASTLPQYHKDNLPALLAFIWEIHTGIKGSVSLPDGTSIEGARITVVNITSGIIKENPHAVTSGKLGDYYRLLTDGKYRVTAEHNGKYDTKCVTVKNYPRHHDAQIVNFVLTTGRKTTLCCKSEETEKRKTCDAICQRKIILKEIFKRSMKKNDDDVNE